MFTFPRPLTLLLAVCTLSGCLSSSNPSDGAASAASALRTAQSGIEPADNQTPQAEPAALANVDLKATSAALRAEHGRVDIQFKPFHLDFVDGAGRIVLSTSKLRNGRPSVRAPSPSRAPGGGQVFPQDSASYAPFSFTIGQASTAQFPATFWVGDILFNAMTGMEFELTDVLETKMQGNTLVLKVASNDPSGSFATVQIAPAENRSFAVSVKVQSSGLPVSAVASAFGSSATEQFYGFGGRRNALSQRGEAFLNWTEEFAQTVERIEAVNNALFGRNFQFPTGPQGSYYIHSLFASNKGYGFLLDRNELSHWRMASDKPDAWRVEVFSDQTDFLVVTGRADEVVSKLSGINGRHRVPPQWALGPMLSETIQEFSDNPENYTRKVLESLDRIEALKLPVSAFAFEGWIGTKETGRYEEIIDRLKSMNIKPMTYYRAFVGQQDDELEERNAYEEAIAGGFVAKDRTGQPYLIGSPLMGRGVAAVIDFTNPKAVAWWKGRVRKTLDEGVEGFMQDFGEQILTDMQFHDGSNGKTMHNRNAVLYHKATREAFDDYVRANPAREPWFFVRNGYSGRRGSSHYESAVWGGDNTSDWSRSSGIGAVIPDMLNRGVGGAYGFVSEISGYIDFAGRVSEELLIRWANMASLMPVHRLHGGPVNGTPMPWRYGSDKVVEDYRATAQRHIRAQPLIMALWKEALATGVPITRPMWFAFPDDEVAARQDQQYMLGPDVLVAPVVTPGVTGRDVYFPKGCWQHAERDEVVQGPRMSFIAAKVNELPYFFRCGTRPF